tara:strand:+ start:846 stop:3371 length:2526 start_codon:yes stop_codon:yes gene_type:complete
MAAAKTKAPRYTSILGQPHMLAYINPEEEKLLRARGGMGLKGPAGILAYPPDSVIDSDYDEISGNSGDASSNNLDDTFGSGNIYTESSSGASTVNYGNSGNSGDGNPDGDEYQGPNTDGSAGYFWDPKYYTTNDKGEITGIDTKALTGEAGYVANILEKTPQGKAILWLGGINFETDKVETYNGVAVYTRENGTNYSFNKLGLPYDVSVGSDGSVNDITDYSRIQELLASDNQDDKDLAKALQVSQAVNTAEEKGAYDADALTELLSESGMDASNVDLKAMLDDPSTYINNLGANLTDLVPTMDADTAGTNIDGTKDIFTQGDDPSYTATQVQNAVKTSAPTAGTSVGYNEALIGDKVTDNEKYKVDSQQGSVSEDEKIDSSDYEIDMEGAYTGINEDGSTNYAGKALNKYATQDISTIIDTSTVSGKLLADKLGEGNYTDSKATIIGQMDIIGGEFKDADGQPKIPSWAQGAARNVQKTIAFSGMSGTAATAALANALMESALGIAEKEASFFQTLTIENLDNRQEAFINKANVLSKFELNNMDAREAAAVNNAQKLFDMNLENLSNDQQAEVLNKKAAVDALFEDTKAKNAERLFSAEAENDFKKYYDGLIMRANEATALAENEMKRFNAGEVNDASEFNAKIENDRDQYYSDLQYNIDLSNAKWRQTVVETETEMKFDAASEDVKNILDLSQEGLNRMWDRIDSQLDYLFKNAENEADRDRAILIAQIQAQASQQKSNSSGGFFGFLGDLVGSIAGDLDWGDILDISDTALKENIRKTGTAKNGLGLYEWDWTEEGKRISKGQRTKGYLAQEVAQKYPQAVKVGEDGHLRINYRKLPT